MRKRSLVLLIAMLMVSPLFINGCSRDDTAIVRIQLVNVPDGAAQSSNTVFERVFRWFVPSAWALSFWTSTLDSMELVISAPDMEDITMPIPKSERNISIELPVGPERRITIYGYESGMLFGKNWGGHVELNLNPGDDISVDIRMLPVTKFEYSSFIGGIELHWFALSAPAYDLQGYKIYRSDYLDGPYNFIGLASGATQSVFTDSSSHIVGNHYYYKISTFSSMQEGELSDAYDVNYYP